MTFASDDEARAAYARGERIAELMNDPVVDQVFDETERVLLAMIADSFETDTEIRERAYAQIKALRLLRSNMIKVADDGSLAAVDLGLTPTKRLFRWR